MTMTEEEKREKRLKLGYEDSRTHFITLFAASMLTAVSTLTLFAMSNFAWIGTALITFLLYLWGQSYYIKMGEEKKELEEMYAPKKDGNSEQKKREKVSVNPPQNPKPISIQKRSKR